MKIELEISDLESYFFNNNNIYGHYEDYEVSQEDIRDGFIERAIEKFAENYFDDSYDYRNAIMNSINEIVKNNKDKIIENVINNVTEEILKKKDIVNNMPKKSEVANISKEWENYFIELIDKAIAKRFK